MPKIYVDTVEFYNALHRNPEQDHRERWVFQLRTRTRYGNHDEQVLEMGQYADALAQAKIYAQNIGASVIYVLP